MSQMNHEMSAFLVLQICVCSVPIHWKFWSHGSVGEKTLNVRGAPFPQLCDLVYLYIRLMYRI